LKLSWNDRAARGLVIVVLAAGAAIVAVLNAPDRPRRTDATRAEAIRGTPDELSIALTGDAALVDALPRADPGVQAVSALLAGSSVAVSNFELTALAEPPPPGGDEVRWPAAAPGAAADLRSLGINVVSLANNHVHDYGLEGMRETERLLDVAGVRHAGTGNTLAEARAAATIDTPAGRVAFISIAASHAPLARAAAARGEIGGRPGLNPLRYTRRVTIDAAAFAALRDSLVTGGLPEGASEPAEGQLKLFGTLVTRGERTTVELVEDPADVRELVEEIRRARAAAAAVVVAIHAHEPSNLVDEVPSFLRRVAHQAIDAGADLVAGHGPHRLRGVEVYKKRPILYSLGNFIFQDRAFQPGAADIFEDATHTMLAGIAEPVDDGRPVLDYADDVWWESVVVRATFRKGEFVRLELHPIDLGIRQPKETRGTPRLAPQSAAVRILERITRLSAPLGTKIHIRNGVAFITADAVEGS
jgi:poly-gamma-glutamate synthesis protein (capsule biosynthesis protein)